MDEGSRIGTGSKNSNSPGRAINSQSETQNTSGQALKHEKRSKVKKRRPGSNIDSLSHKALYNLGKSHQDRYEQYGAIDDINKAIEYEARAVDLTPKGQPDLRLRLANLGLSYRYRFQRLGELDDIEKAVENQSRALDLTPNGHPDLPLRLNDLGLSYRDRFRRLGELENLEKAIEYGTRALDLTPDKHPDLPLRLSNLGESYDDRFQRLDELKDIEKAIELETRALELTPEGHSDLPTRLANLGFSYRDRFQRLGELDDLEKAIKYKSHALHLTPYGYQESVLQFANLGASYYDRFKRLGELEDLDKAIELESRALALTLDGHPELPVRLTNLGLSYRDRFERLGELDDLNKAIELQSRAIVLTPDDHSHLPIRLVNLAWSYHGRFERVGKLDDLEKEIELESRALSLTPDDHPSLPVWLANLGMSYHHRFERLGKLDDLEKGIEHKSRAINLTPDGHPDLPHRLTHLGLSYHDRFEHLSEQADLEKAMKYQARALELTPDGHPDLPERYFNKAKTVFLQYQRTADPFSLKDSLDSFRKASQLSTGAPRDVFHNALHWAKLSSKHSSLNCMEAYQVTMDLLPQFIWLGATTNQRYHDLSMAENLAIKAAYAAILHSDCKLALEWLEHARCVVWNQSLTLRSPLDELYSSHPDLATRLQTIAKQLQDASTEFPISQALSSDSTASEQAGQQRRRLAKEYNTVLAEARTLKGFEDFLQPVKAEGLARAAQNGPIVAINCHEDSCDALLILPGNENIMHLPLPNFNEKKARDARYELEESVRRKGLRQRGFKARLPPGYKDGMMNVLVKLWEDVVKPILEFLGFKNDISIDSLPHITWCPTGTLSFLPLHAAGDYDQPRSRVFDYAISSYTPTLTALLASGASNTSNRTPRLLAIGQSNTPGHTPLPGTARELECVRAHTQNKAEYAQLRDGQATTAAVLDAMGQHDWVHLACHAHQNVDDPTKSGFFLYDGTLDLASINRRSFKNKGLAFLSACQTATGDEKLPDEAIHLASGMLMAGYPSVIATMWSVVDDDAPFIADKVYARLMEDGKIGNGEAGKALHYAVAALRDKLGEKEFARWVPYIHIGS